MVAMLVAGYSRADLDARDNIGRKTILDVEVWLAGFGLSLREAGQ
jgi:hypothetical protein